MIKIIHKQGAGLQSNDCLKSHENSYVNFEMG